MQALTNGQGKDSVLGAVQRRPQLERGGVVAASPAFDPRGRKGTFYHQKCAQSVDRRSSPSVPLRHLCVNYSFLRSQSADKNSHGISHEVVRNLM
jgi:hypothetical protein